MLAVGFLRSSSIMRRQRLEHSNNELICSSPGNNLLFLYISLTLVLEGPLVFTLSLMMCRLRSKDLRLEHACSSHGGSQWQSSCGETKRWSGGHGPIRWPQMGVRITVSGL